MQRDLLSNPFALMLADPTWLTASVINMARVIGEERAFEDLPILGDALEDAGCSDERILSHCRGHRPHVRGCWVLDLILANP